MLHLTYTGAQAGTYFCLSYTSVMGHAPSGQRLPGDRASHYAYTSAETLARPDVCPDCLHVSECDDAACARCAALGYSGVTDDAASILA